MQKINLIREIVVKKKAEEEKLNLKLEELKGKKKKKLTEEMATYFSGILCDPDGDAYIEVSDSYIYFKMQHEDYKYPKEILSLSLRGESFRHDDINRIETGFYSTTENSVFELNRMVLLGKAAEIILDHKDDILAEWNFVTESFSGKISDARKKVWKAEKLVSENGEKVTAIENEIVKEKLFGEGIKFEMPEGGARHLPEFDARWNYRIDKVTSIRATRKTASGKSYDVEGTFAINRWDSDKNEYYTEDSCFEIKAVKAENIDRMLLWNRELIKE